MSRLIAIVPARAGSVGIPGKNLKNLAGAPLVAWTLAPALAACDLVVLSSESDEIHGWAAKHYVSGGRLVRQHRSQMLATSRTPDLPVVQSAYRFIDNEPDDVILLLRPTAPFRRPEEIRDVVALLRSYPVDSVRSVVPAREHPQKMYLETGFAGVPGPLLEPAMGPRHRANHPRQWLPKAWSACGFIDAVWADGLVGMDSLEGDVILGWPAPADRSFDLDTPEQWAEAERLAQARGWKPGEVG